LHAQVGPTAHVLCARNDHGSSIRFPECENSEPALRCSTNGGGVQGVTEGAVDPFGSLGRWRQFKLYPAPMATVLDGAAASVTALTDGCATLMPNGQVLACSTNDDCAPGCDIFSGTCNGDAFNVNCSSDTDCNFGTCLLDGEHQLD